MKDQSTELQLLFALFANRLRSASLTLRPAASMRSLANLEKEYGPLPKEMRSFYERFDGMDEMDPKNRIRLWRLDEIKPATDEVKEDQQLCTGVEDQLVFADYLIWSWAFVIDVRGDGSVSIIGGGAPERVASSFGDFLRLFIDDDGSNRWLT